MRLSHSLIVFSFLSTARSFVYQAQPRPFLPSSSLHSDLFEVYPDGPLPDGENSCQWVGLNEKGEDGENDQVLPVFPLGGVVYTPGSTPTLNIFEPRYRSMYNDILLNGSRRFVVVTSSPSNNDDNTGVKFGRYGVVFYLTDLNDISDKTGDSVKYVVQHAVVGIVRVNEFINPEVWGTRETYLKAKVEVVEEDLGMLERMNIGSSTAAVQEEKEEKDEPAFRGRVMTPSEVALSKSYADLVNLQHSSDLPVRFTKSSISTFATGPGFGGDAPGGGASGAGSLWSSIGLWQRYIEQRLVGRERELQEEFQNKLVDYLKGADGEVPSAVSFNDLPDNLKREVQELEIRMNSEIAPLVKENNLTIQRLLEAGCNAGGDEEKALGQRCDVLRWFIEEEGRRIRAREGLKNLFSANGDEGKGAEGAGGAWS